MKNAVQLITYVDRLTGADLNHLHRMLQDEFDGLFSGLHILPFFNPIDGEDAGFDPIDHTKVDNRLGSWSDFKNLAQDYEVMVDMIVNHVSAQSPYFLDYLEKGEASPYARLFLHLESVFPNGATENDLLKIYRPRPGMPFSVYNFKNGDKGLFWTTFTKSQIDINVNHEQGWHYLVNILDTFEENLVTSIRLDATGYAIKKAGTSCFMLPETFEFIEKLKHEANQRNIQVLVEIHSHYSTQIEISKHADFVYDFALPPLILHTIISQSSSNLQSWLKIAPRNAITVLDTHDGIGIIDAGPSSHDEEDGLLSASEIDDLVNAIHKNSHGNSLKATGTAASNVDLYQVNCTFYEALGSDGDKYLLARLIQFFSPGIPQVYYVGLLAGKNDMALLEKTGVGRDINRQYFNKEDLKAALNREEVKHLHALIRFRNNNPAFSGEFSIENTASDTLKIKYVKNQDSVGLEINLNANTFSVTSCIDERRKLYNCWDDFLV